jgi:hypothetical protein
MTPSEIIVSDCLRNKVDYKPVLNYIARLIQDKKGVILQNLNSILLLKYLSKNEVELHLFTADKPVSAMKAVKHFIKTIKEMPLKAVYGKSSDPQVKAMLESSGVTVEKSDKPEFQWMAKV